MIEKEKMILKRAQSTGRLIFWILVCITVLLYGQNATLNMGSFLDAPHHLANSIFIHDALLHPWVAASDPKTFILTYYSYFPAVNVGYYPPVFYTIAALLMFVFGVSASTVQLTVLLFALAMTWCSYSWMRLHLPALWAGMGTLLIITSSHIVYWGRDIMLEVPVLALSIASIWFFELMLREDSPRWRTAIAWSLVTVSAIWTKQNAVILVPFFFVVLLAVGRWRLILRPAVAVNFIIILGAAAGIIMLLAYTRGDSVVSTVGINPQQVQNRLNAAQWIYYADQFPWLIGWPLLVTSILGIVVTVIERDKLGLIIPVAWLLVFYIVHSYDRQLDHRYALICVPALSFLAARGLHGLPAFISGSHQVAAATALGWLVMIALIGYSAVEAARVEVPRVSGAYAHAMAKVRDELGKFTCLTFAAESSRPASLYRLAIAELGQTQTDIFSYGRILRGVQVLGRTDHSGVTPEEISASLKRWNVTMILMERDLSSDMPGEAQRTAAILEKVLALGEFELLASYKVGGAGSSYPVPRPESFSQDRTLSLYKRKMTIEFNERATPPVKPRRSRLEVDFSS